MSSNQEILSAVNTGRAASSQGIQQRMFAKWFDAFVYNQIWEDPRVDLQALELDQGSRVLTISSGGCNALNYLLERPESVTAVDLNRHHIFLLDLKIAAARFLPGYEEFFAYFGHGKTDDAATLYDKFLAPNLSVDARSFWESKRPLRGRRIDFFTGSGLYNHSRNGYFLGFFHKLSRLLGCDVERILGCKTLEDQAACYDKYIAPFFDSILIKIIGKMPVTLFGLGIPPQQYQELTRDLGQHGTIIDVYRERVKRLACGFPIAENYFTWQAFARRYDTEDRIAVPDYLKPENFESLRENVENIRTNIGSVTDEIRRQSAGTFNRFVFLDAQDWMNADAMTELWSLIAERGGPGSRIIFRTAGAASPIETNVPANVRSRFVYEEELSKALFLRDRASIYGGFHLYRLK